MQEYVHTLGNIVRQERMKAGLTQDELAERVGIDPRTILKIENHRGNPKMEVLYPLIRALNIDANQVFYPDIHKDSTALKQFQFFLSQCSPEEIQSMHQICRTVLSVLKSNSTIDIQE